MNIVSRNTTTHEHITSKQKNMYLLDLFQVNLQVLLKHENPIASHVFMI